MPYLHTLLSEEHQKPPAHKPGLREACRPIAASYLQARLSVNGGKKSFKGITGLLIVHISNLPCCLFDSLVPDNSLTMSFAKFLLVFELKRF